MNYLGIIYGKVFVELFCLLIGLQVMAENQTPIVSTPQSFKTYSGTMKGPNLTGISDIVTRSHIVNIRADEVLFTSQRYCGDSDVVSYYSSHPNEANANKRVSEKVVLGYWVSDVAVRAVPDDKSWFMFGYGDLPIDGGELKTLSRPNESSQVSIGTLVNSEADLILKQLDAAPPTLPGKSHYVYFAAMLCNELEDSSGAASLPGPFVPRASSIASGLIAYQRGSSQTDAELHSDDLAKNQMKAKVTFVTNDKASVKVSFVAGSVSQSNFGNALESLQSLNYPSVKAPAVLKMGDYRSAIGSTKSKLTQLVAFCTNENTKTAPEFWWESVPLHIACKNIVSPTFSANIDSFNGGSAKDSDGPVPETEFTTLKKNLLKIVGSSEILTQAQADIKNQGLTQNKARCFPAGGRPYIETTIASLPFTVEAPIISGSNITYSIGGPKTDMTHPEGNYISIAASIYYPNAGAVFMTPGSPMIVTTPLPSNRKFNISNGIFQFHVRDIGCTTGPTFCQRIDKLDYLLRTN